MSLHLIGMWGNDLSCVERCFFFNMWDVTIRFDEISEFHNFFCVCPETSVKVFVWSNNPEKLNERTTVWNLEHAITCANWDSIVIGINILYYTHGTRS